MKRPYFYTAFCLSIFVGQFFVVYSQSNNNFLIGYWHNWNDLNAPYIPLDEVDERYDVVALSFAIPTSVEDMTMQFVPDGTSPAILQSQIGMLKAQGKKVLISVGGATASINLDTEDQKNDFVESMNSIISDFGFNGLDIDIEYGSAILVAGGTIVNPTSVSQLNLIDAVNEIMEHYHLQHGEKLFLTFTPETAYVQGGQSGYGGIWGGYLPLIHALRDSIDILQVQLYNSGTMFGIDGGVYTQGTADFIVSQIEAVIQGFNTAGGFFEGLPAEKIAVGLPACNLAAGGGFVSSGEVVQAVNYLMGIGTQPGDYQLSNLSGYPDIKGLMTWSINWDAVESCGGDYGFADTYDEIFNVITDTAFRTKQDWSIYPNPASDFFFLKTSTPEFQQDIRITDASGREVFRQVALANRRIDVSALNPGFYLVTIGEETRKLVVK